MPELGAAVVEPCLAFLEDDDAFESHDAATEILAKCGVRDERIFDAICNVLDDNRVLGAIFLADYGDERGGDLVLDEIENFDPSSHGAMALSDLRELLHCFDALGGVLPDDVAADLRVLEERLEEIGMTRRRSTKKIGRNEPCPCGSGKKYKKCCIDAKAAEPFDLDGAQLTQLDARIAEADRGEVEPASVVLGQVRSR